MKLAQSLYVETLALLVLYLSALIAVVFIVFNTQFGAGWDALMQSPLGDKVDTVADAVSNQLRSSPEKKWDEVLDLFGGLYHVKFSVFDLEGRQVAGEKIDLPVSVLDQFALPLPPHFGMGRSVVGASAKDGVFAEFPAEERGFAGWKTFTRRMERIYPHASKNLYLRLPPADGPHRLPLDDFPAPALRGRSGFTFGTGMENEPGRPFPGPPMSVQIMRIPRLPTPAHGRFLIHTTRPDHFYFGTRIDLVGENYVRPGPSVLLASTDNIWQTGLLLDFKVLAMAAGAIALLSIIFWLPFIYRITRALSDLTLATERIAEGKFDTRLDTRRRDEIGRLSDAVNSMAERLNGFVGAQKRFLADISHELFSPLARLQVALEILDESSSKDQKALIDDIREEVEEMNHLINELIAFSKAEFQGQSRNLVSVNIDEMFFELRERLGLKQRASIEIAEGLCVVGDRLLLERSFSNVLRNSVRYAGDDTPISIKAAVAGNNVSIVMQDCGPGVPQEALKHLAEPFFRPEKSRSRDTGGVGLGLAIVKSCVEACGGTLQVRNREGGGLEVEVILKLAQATASGSLAAEPHVSS
ncbi:MAG TPA: HAMP domain-containing sensor histidine kinase [Candidatus Melainabacteria bacterium]|nr:HAMP domain-containing sensor histidine kinase [Candidatus Melainabacteria bacterium]